MEAEELGGSWVISVDELGVVGLWTTIKDVSGSCLGCVCLALVARYTLRCARWQGAHSRALRAAILALQRAPHATSRCGCPSALSHTNVVSARPRGHAVLLPTAHAPLRSCSRRAHPSRGSCCPTSSGAHPRSPACRSRGCRAARCVHSCIPSVHACMRSPASSLCALHAHALLRPHGAE